MIPGPAPGEIRIPQSGKSPTVGGRASGSFLHYAPLLNPRNSMSITNTKGLLNMPGQNNCFLNSAVQVLWHLDIFRRSFRELCGHACMEHSCIFCALKELFAQFQYSQESALPPDALRRALAETFCDQRRFQLGFMDDAAECFENILMRIHFHIANSESEDMCSALHCIPHQKFAMTLVEQTVCHACGATSEPLPFTQMVHYVPSSALCSQAKLMKEKSDQMLSFSELLKRAGGLGDLRDCPSSCGAAIQIRKTLMNRPEIVSIGLVWDSERPTIDHIMDVFKTIGMSLKLQDVFHSVVDSRWASTATHQLVGIVTYYGKHYSTFFFHTKLRVWIYFDDAAVREIGPKWEQVVEKCCRGHFQPLLLLYANPHGSPVNTSTAPRVITVVPGHKKNINVKETRGMLSHESPKMFPNSSSSSQRRALTPNPEVSCDISANIQPRRAVTPSGELSWTDGTSDAQQDSKDNSSTQNIRNSVHSNQSLTQNPRNQEHTSPMNGISDNTDPTKTSRISVHSSVPKCVAYSDGYQHKPQLVNSPSIVLNRPASVDDILKSTTMSNTEMDKQHYCLSDGNSHTVNTDDNSADMAYISRKAVENVLHLQKLQRQRSITHKNGHIIVGQRNSSSSLESLDNVFLNREKVLNGYSNGKLEIPDAVTMARRRDSGNWSGGDRSSASSSSTTSLDNPYFYVLGNKRIPNCPRPIGRPGEMLQLTDPGYDSFSVSSSDSYPSAINCSPGKLGQIPEHVQTAFVPYDISQLQYCLKDIKSNDHFPFGLKDDCDKLCAEADIFVAKSIERENVGDISMAALLSDTAAAKARTAMDMPYTSSQGLAMAKMKHSMCLIRSSNLHKKIKEAEAALCRKSKEFSAESQHLSSKSSLNGSNNSENSCQNSKEEAEHSQTESGTEIKSSGGQADEHLDKNIEIYATLPKRSLKKKGALSSFVESLTGEESSDEKPKEKNNQEIKIDGQKFGTNSEKSSKSPSSKKKSHSHKNLNKDSDLSDYSSEWEQTKKPSLYRTYSGPTNSKNELSDLNSSCNQSFNDHPTKKQHRIRRKLMGGFMKRKNRSLPDLREGQDSGSETTRSYDDCFFTQTPVPTRKKQDVKNTGNINDQVINSQSPNASKQSKKNIRTHTPPPYKPPPPITHSNSNVLSTKRVFQHPNAEAPKSEKVLSNHVVNIPNVQELMKAKSQNHMPLCRDMKSQRKILPQYMSNEMPANAAWLKELQMKQDELNQKKKLQEERERWINECNSGASSKLVAAQNSDATQNLSLKAQPKTMDENTFVSRSPQKVNQAQNSNSQTTERDSSKSVRDLTSKFENVTVDQTESHQQKCTSSPQVLSSSLPVENKIYMMPPQAGTNGTHIEHSRPLPTIGHRLAHQKSPVKESDPSKLQKDRLNGMNSAKQTFYNQNLSSSVYNSHLTDAQLTNVLRIGTNRSSFRNSNGQVEVPDDNLARYPKDVYVLHEAKRPDKPPDYETAIQRLELLRNDRHLSNCCINGNCLSFEALLEQAKKRRGPKKSVTFSDKVVLVACAGDEDNDFIPNPLLERVYKQHFLQNAQTDITQASTSDLNPSAKPKDCMLSTSPSHEVKHHEQDSPKVCSQSSCHLCHKKLVDGPNLYCPDCSFYMSRFQQK